MMTLAQRVEQVLQTAVTQLRPLHGGSIAEVYTATLADGRQIVAKVDRSPRPSLDLEAWMLAYLANHSQLPVPAVYHSQPDLLLMAYLEGESRFSPTAQQHAAELLAALHAITAPHYGMERDTLIGSLPQPNPPTASWLEFFRDHRLRHRGQAAMDAGRLPRPLFGRLERFAGQLGRWLAEPERPSLIHGDVWTTNVLAVGNRITGFLDPAIYYADPEIELAFSTLFGTFDQPFFQQYEEIRPLAPGFLEERRDIYNLYPLLVHVHLFGGSYVRSVERTLERFGY